MNDEKFLELDNNEMCIVKWRKYEGNSRSIWHCYNTS